MVLEFLSPARLAKQRLSLRSTTTPPMKNRNSVITDVCNCILLLLPTDVFVSLVLWVVHTLSDSCQCNLHSLIWVDNFKLWHVKNLIIYERSEVRQPAMQHLRIKYEELSHRVELILGRHAQGLEPIYYFLILRIAFSTSMWESPEWNRRMEIFIVCTLGRIWIIKIHLLT